MLRNAKPQVHDVVRVKPLTLSVSGEPVGDLLCVVTAVLDHHLIRLEHTCNRANIIVWTWNVSVKYRPNYR